MFTNVDIYFIISATLLSWAETCKEGEKEVGVCLHIYLERDFLALENIVYPSLRNRQRYKRSNLQNLKEEKQKYVENSEIYAKRSDLSDDSEKNSKNLYYSDEVGHYGRHKAWIEGPELEDHCIRLKEVLKCFEDVLVDCESGYHFFRYRRLLHSLSSTHKFLCSTAYMRKERFLWFLKTIECAERARREELMCSRHNISSNVWNKILRVESGEELCDSLNTQRACLLQNNFIAKHCRDPRRVKTYEYISHYFLATWCGYPIHPKLLKLVMENRAHLQSSSSFWMLPFMIIFTRSTLSLLNDI